MPSGPPPDADEAIRLSAIAQAWDIQWDSLPDQRKATFAAQERALAEYAESRGVLNAAQAANVHYESIESWRRDNVLRFKERWAQADLAFLASIEKRITGRIDDPAGNRGSDVLLMFWAKAHAPELYRELPAMDDEVARETLTQLRKLSKKAHSNEKRL
jgi:hypothetical protein